MKRLIIACFCLVAIVTQAQNLPRVEYYWDTDPGYGQAQAITANFDGDSALVNTSFSLDELSAGVHTLGIRARSANGQWSPTYLRQVLADAFSITRVEYFWDDNDPGYGNATAYPINQNNGYLQFNDAEFSTIGLAPGIHYLNIRAKSSYWSPTYRYQFYVNDNVEMAEYFWDTDPGFGSGIQIPLVADTMVEVNLSNIPLPASYGKHTLHIRVRSMQKWSPVYEKEYCVGPLPEFTPSLNQGAVCQNAQMIIFDQTIGANSSTLYRWDMDGDGVTDDTTRGDWAYTYSAPGTYRATLSVTNDPSCFNTYSYEIKVNALAAPTISIARSTSSECYGTEVFFASATTNADAYQPTYEWYRNDILIPGADNDTLFISDLNQGDNIKARVTTNNYCRTTNTAISSPQSITIKPLPELTMHEHPFVFTDQTAFTLTGMYATTPTGGSYAINGTAATVFNPQANPMGDYELSYTYTGTNGCTNSITDTFTLMNRIAYQMTTTSDTAQGHTTGSGMYDIGDTAIIASVAGYGYHFDHWTDGNTENPRMVTVVKDTLFRAEFALNVYQVELSTTQSVRGIVEGNAQCTHGYTDTITAVPNYGYYFQQWSDGDTNNPRVVTVMSDTAYAAQFGYLQFSLEVGSSDTVKGIVVGSCVDNYLSNKQIRATANYGYQFLMWNDGVTANPRVVQLTKDTLFVAVFDNRSYTVAATASSAAAGSVSGAGTYRYLDVDTLVATANYGYHFANWSDGDTANPRYLTVTGNATLTAVFASNIYQVMVESADTAKGSVSGSGNYSYLSSAMLTATPSEGYHFLGWSDGVVSNPRMLTILRDTLILADFAINQYDIIAVSNQDAGGQVIGAGMYNHFDTVTLLASPNHGYHFSHWSDGDTSNPRIFEASSNVQLTAHFEKNNYLVRVEMNDTLGGRIIGEGFYQYESYAVISVMENVGFDFVGWSDGSVAPTLTVLVTNDTTLFASFAHEVYQVSASSADESMGHVSGAGLCQYGDSVVLLAEAVGHHHFVRWSDGDTDNPRVIYPTSNIDIQAFFAIDEYWIEVTSNDIMKGIATGSGLYPYGAVVTAEATAFSGYKFWKWSNEDEHNPYTFAASQDIELVAIFIPEDSVGIDSQMELPFEIWTYDDKIIVSGAGNNPISILDAVGRLVATNTTQEETRIMRVPASGVYMVQVGGRPAQKVVVVR